MTRLTEVVRGRLAEDPRLRTMTLAIALAACGSASIPPASSVPASAPETPKIDAFAKAALDDHKAVGLSIAVARGDKLLVAKGYGFADLEHKTPATADTVYRIGSITKQFTAVAILQLAERGRLQLTDDLRRYVPEFPAKPKPVTLEHLLTHTSGIANYTDVKDWLEIGAKPMPRAQLLARFVDKPLEFDPGTRWEYSNSNYYLLGMVIEAVTKRPYADVIRDQLLVPAGMRASGYCSEAMPHHAQGYSLKGGEPKPALPVDMAHPFAAGALCATVTDMIAWQRALDTGKLLRPETLARMRTQATLADGKPTGYGYGLFLGEIEGHHRVGHGGGINGFTSMLARYPDDDLTIAVLANAEVDTPDKLEQKIARLELGLPEQEVKHDQVVAAAERTRYVGTYKIEGFGPDAVEVKVFEDGAALKAQVTGQPVATLLYQGKRSFRLDLDPDVELVFADGEHAPGFTLHQAGMTIEAKRAP
jgi:CubicO group peptidase (beta-lactamase class C family)